jgi:hypothetical protein
MTSIYTDTFFVLDFDRCIGDTDGIQAVLEKVLLQETGILPSLLSASRTQIESTGRTFDTIRHVQALLSEAGNPVSWEHLREALIAEASSADLLLPDARNLLRKLQDSNLAYGIITYGIEEAWQLTKLELTGLLDVPHLVTRIETKGELLSGWKQPDGSFIVPPALSKDFVPKQVSKLIFLDDKAKSFWSMPSGVEGVHIVAPGGNNLPSQQGELPSHVTDVIGIGGAIQLLFK